MSDAAAPLLTGNGKSSDQILDEIFSTLISASTPLITTSVGDVPADVPAHSEPEDGGEEKRKAKRKKERKEKKKEKKQKREIGEKVKKKKKKKSKEETDENADKSRREGKEEDHGETIADKPTKPIDMRTADEMTSWAARESRRRGRDAVYRRSGSRDRAHREPLKWQSRSPIRSRHSLDRRRRQTRSRSPVRQRPSPVRERGRRFSRSPVVSARSSSREAIDKVLLLRVARENLRRMQVAGKLPADLTLPASLGPVEAPPPAPTSSFTAKTVAELTDYCKNLVARTGDENRPWKSNGDGPESAESVPNERAAFTRHPFQLKIRPDPIVLNVGVPLPLRKPEERASLKQQFPVSSGSQHLELEWVPVAPAPSTKHDLPKKAKTATVAPSSRLSASVPKSPPTPDIGSVVAQRISSIHKLQETPKDSEAQSQLQEADLMCQNWANYRHTNPLTGEPIPGLVNWNTAPQAWVKKDQFVNAAPVAGGVGMKLLQKMGWQPGEGLGPNKKGALEPLALDIKTDKKGLLSKEETAPGKTVATIKLIQDFQGKHPVSVLHELCVKKRWEPPLFEQIADMGPDHLKHFLFRVTVNGNEYRSSVASTTKKEAKAMAAAICLQSLDIVLLC